MARRSGMQVCSRQGRSPQGSRGEQRSVIPMHGSGKELGKGLVEKIKKELGLK